MDTSDVHWELDRSGAHIENSRTVNEKELAMYRVQRAKVQALLVVAAQLARLADTQEAQLDLQRGGI